MKDRVYGPTFLRHCVLASPAPLTHYFLGGSADCVAKLVAAFRAANPAVNIVGRAARLFSARRRGPDHCGNQRTVAGTSSGSVWARPGSRNGLRATRPGYGAGWCWRWVFAFDVNAGTKAGRPRLDATQRTDVAVPSRPGAAPAGGPVSEIQQPVSLVFVKGWNAGRKPAGYFPSPLITGH